ncbi:ATP-binding protein [Zooshikella marina]|uniref:ATP-binding protein n=1 Tax=Zooshikella ganghwensis TaxID=202772 RepID=UPI001BB085E1|nr:ATP-binding protein [Zooshikella ganghwensis]MBU2708778.1 ATP-binding protein [Zooshikella ganghwensis]
MAISLSSISKTTGLKAPRVLLYGVPGIGKTTFAAGAPKPIFLFTEDGAGLLELDSFPVLKSYEDTTSALNALLCEEHEFKTVVLDSLDHLEPLVWDIVAKKAGKNSIEEIGFGKGYIEALAYWRVILDLLDRLRVEKKMAVILISHSNIKRFDSPETEPYDRYQLKLHDKASALMQEWSDCVLFCNYQTTIQRDKLSNGQDKARGVGTGQRNIYTVEKPAYKAKNRFNLPEKMPLSWEAFMTALQTNSQRGTTINNG